MMGRYTIACRESIQSNGGSKEPSPEFRHLGAHKGVSRPMISEAPSMPPRSQSFIAADECRQSITVTHPFCKGSDRSQIALEVLGKIAKPSRISWAIPCAAWHIPYEQHTTSA